MPSRDWQSVCSRPRISFRLSANAQRLRSGLGSCVWQAPATNSRHAEKRPLSTDICEAPSLAHGNASKWPRRCRSRAAALPGANLKLSRPCPRHEPLCAHYPRTGALIPLLQWRLLSGNFNRVGCRSASGHLFNADPVEDRRAPFPALSGDTSRFPPHGAALQNLESVSARALMFWRIGQLLIATKHNNAYPSVMIRPFISFQADKRIRAHPFNLLSERGDSVKMSSVI
jgi:hypothetical protein